MSDIGNINSDPQDVPLKRCQKCGETKPRDEFHKNKNKRDGLSSQCKQCVAKYQRENPEKSRECNARYRIANIDKAREISARYYLENSDKERERSARYYRENIDKKRESSARYRRENPDKLRAKDHRRRAAERALPAQWTDGDIQRMLEHWGNRCAICGQHIEPNNAFYYLAHDHWIPLTSPECPGTVSWNILPLCHSKIGNTAGCNNLKSNADPIEWLNSLYTDEPKQVAKILANIARYFKTVKGILS